MSLFFGDSLQLWRQSPFQFIVDGTWWVPPPLPIMDPNNQSERTLSTLSQHLDRNSMRRELERGGSRRRGRILLGARPLSEFVRLTLMNTLRHLNSKRQTIREAMAFCIDNSFKCTEVVEIISESLTISHTSAEKKLARLYLLSDILHNSKVMVKNASAYRTEIKKRLRGIFISIKECYDLQESSTDSGSKLKSDFRNRVKSVLYVWDRWNLFPANFVDSLRLIFLPDFDKADQNSNGAGMLTCGANKENDVEDDVPEILAMALVGKVDDDEEAEMNGEPMDD